MLPDPKSQERIASLVVGFRRLLHSCRSINRNNRGTGDNRTRLILYDSGNLSAEICPRDVRSSLPRASE